MAETIHWVGICDTGNWGTDDSSEQWSPSLQQCSDMCLLVEIFRSWESHDCSRPWLLDVGLQRAEEAEVVNSHAEFPLASFFSNLSIPTPFPL